MIDVKQLRDDPDKLREALKSRGADPAVVDENRNRVTGIGIGKRVVFRVEDAVDQTHKLMRRRDAVQSFVELPHDNLCIFKVVGRLHQESPQRSSNCRHHHRCGDAVSRRISNRHNRAVFVDWD